MTDNEPSDDVSASATGPLRWPDPSRPIVNQQPPYHGSPMPGTGGWYPQGLPVSPGLRRRWWPLVVAAIVVLVVALVAVWLLWWR